MNQRAPAIGRFFVRCLLWLAPCYAAWLLASPAWTRPAAALAALLLRAIHPPLAAGLELAGNDATFVTDIVVPLASGALGTLTPEVDTRLYTHGLALFLALMLASRTSWKRVLVGAVALLPVHAWGIAFDVLMQLVRLGPQVDANVGLTRTSIEAIALGYQAGSVLLPVLAPVALWVALNRPFVASLTVVPPQSRAAGWQEP